MTPVLLFAMALFNPMTPPELFEVQAELQGLYDEISQATLQFVSMSDVDLFHEVLYAPDWVFIDETGQKRGWSDERPVALQALSAPLPQSMSQSIQKLSLGADDATATVRMTTVRSIVDQEGRYGRQGASHTLTQVTMFRDRWVKASEESWKLKSRQQIGRPIESVDRRE